MRGYIWDRRKKGDTAGVWTANGRGGGGGRSGEEKNWFESGTIFRLDVRIERDVSPYAQRFVFSLRLRTCNLQLSTRRSQCRPIGVTTATANSRETPLDIDSSFIGTERVTELLSLLVESVCVYSLYYESRTSEELMLHE